MLCFELSHAFYEVPHSTGPRFRSMIWSKLHQCIPRYIPRFHREVSDGSLRHPIFPYQRSRVQRSRLKSLNTCIDCQGGYASTRSSCMSRCAELALLPGRRHHSTDRATVVQAELSEYDKQYGGVSTWGRTCVRCCVVYNVRSSSNRRLCRGDDQARAPTLVHLGSIQGLQGFDQQLLRRHAPIFLMLKIADVSCFELRRLLDEPLRTVISRVARKSYLQSRNRICAPPQTCFSPRTARAHGRRSLHCRRSIGNSPFHGWKPASLASATALECTVVFHLSLGPYQPRIACASSRATSNAHENAD
jgi:hypothetical protein